VILEYVQLQLPSPFWSVKLFAFFIQLGFLLVLIFQIQSTSRNVPSGLFHFTVDATKEEGIDTRLSLHSGQRIKITANGEVSIDQGITWMLPNGLQARGANAGKPLRNVNTHLDEQDGKGLIGALIGWIGDDRGKSSFLVGEEHTMTVPQPGILHLGVNDTKGCYADNTDQDRKPTFFAVRVEILS